MNRVRSFPTFVTRRSAFAAAAFVLSGVGVERAFAQVPYGSPSNSVSSTRVQPSSTFTTTVQHVMPNGTIVLGNGLTVTLGGMSPFGGGSWGSTGVQGGSDFAGYLSPMLMGQSVRVTTLPVGQDQPASGPVPVLMYYGSGYDSLVNQAVVQRGLARYQGQYFQAAPDVREQMRQAEIDAKNRASGMWSGTGSGTTLETLPPSEQRKRIEEHNKRVEAAQKKAAAEAAEAAPPAAPTAPEAPAAPER